MELIPTCCSSYVNILHVMAFTLTNNMEKKRDYNSTNFIIYIVGDVQKIKQCIITWGGFYSVNRELPICRKINIDRRSINI